ncbi:hypothetical protein [Thermomonas carbonis]|uniref:Uncharacterized protein n=1 Tax=Thermomonas carbonis TaxID=1463158 RepID=A0A7G9SS30_9GAMM|nr:hypothetical protein [Thermomonas carbonis]QNN70655.1 hypothetical protein H9L16_03320 [Thermomonas carbonis]GHC01478.1 hypothetical protein GCM10010080_13750 [Thermomonas carbonis]
MTTNDDENQMDDARWQAQERARRLDPDADPAELRIARALRRVPPVSLPVDFAAQVAALALTQPASATAPEQSLLEQRLLRGLVIVFALSAAVVVAWFGRGWVAELAAVLPGGGDAVAWSGVAALCLLGNWSVGLLRGQGMRGSHAAA